MGKEDIAHPKAITEYRLLAPMLADGSHIEAAIYLAYAQLLGAINATTKGT